MHALASYCAVSFLPVKLSKLGPRSITGIYETSEVRLIFQSEMSKVDDVDDDDKNLQPMNLFEDKNFDRIVFLAKFFII